MSALKKTSFAVIVLAVVGGLVAVGAVPKLRRKEALARGETERQGPRRVAIATAGLGDKTAKLAMPATVLPYEAATLYARTGGFVKSTLVEIGDRVKKGQLLAELRAPEAQDDIALSRAKLEEAELNETIARARAERRKQLLKEGLATPDEAEDFFSRANSAQAAKKTTRAELQRLRDIASYQRVVAPFDGVVTKRYLSRGALVVSAGTAVFDLAQTDKLRVVVDVPQSLAGDVRVGTSVRVMPPGQPQKAITASVTRSSGALDPMTRALRVEVELEGGGVLLAGAFADVEIAVDRAAPPVVIPAAALFVRKEGPRVMVVKDGDVVASRPVTIGRDLGKDIELATGVAPGEVLVMNPPDDMLDGEKVETVKPKAAPAPAASASGSAK